MQRVSPTSIYFSEMVSTSRVDDILYEIGLCLQSVRERHKRRAINNPVFTAIVLVLFIIQRLISIALPEDDRRLLYTGDVGHYYGLKFHINFSFGLISVLCLLCQLIFVYNSKRGIYPTFVRVFQVMSGLVTPQSVGLNDRKHIHTIMRFRIVFVIIDK